MAVEFNHTIVPCRDQRASAAFLADVTLDPPSLTSDLAGPLVRRTRAVTDLPVGVGLGVSTGTQATEVAGYADGVIVGSAFVRRLLDAGTDRDAGLASLVALTAEPRGVVLACAGATLK